jgi:hypothetical protein
MVVMCFFQYGNIIEHFFFLFFFWKEISHYRFFSKLADFFLKVHPIPCTIFIHFTKLYSKKEVPQFMRLFFYFKYWIFSSQWLPVISALGLLSTQFVLHLLWSLFNILKIKLVFLDGWQWGAVSCRHVLRHTTFHAALFLTGK